MSDVRPVQRDVPLAIVGMSCLFPQAEDLEAYWKNIRNGVDAITEMPDTHWSADDYFDADPKAPDKTYARRGGFLPPIDFNPLAFGIAPNALEATDTAQLLGLYAAQKALEDAGYGEDADFDRDRVSVLLGVTGTLELSISLGARLGHPHWRRALKEHGISDAEADAIVERISSSYVEWQESSFPGLLGNVVAGRIANRFDLGGTNCVVDAACASSLSALHLAALELASGRCDMALTGGVDTLNDIFMYMCFSKTPALSATGNARPFDAAGDGTILGEGVGLLVLKRLDDAVRDGDRIYAEIRGLGTASDGKGNAIYAPVAKGQAKALRRAYERADITPDTIDLVEAHGTGTVVGDAVESEALGAVYREQREEGTWCAIGSVKSQIGHTKAAAGAASLIKTVLALHHKTLPPTIKVEQPLAQLAPGTSPFYVNTLPRPWVVGEAHPRRAAVSAFGFGGANYHCVLQEHVPAEVSENAPGDQPDWDGDVQVLPLQGETRAALTAELRALLEIEDHTALRTLAAAKRAAFDPKAAQRLILVWEQGEVSVAEMARRALALLDTREESSWSTPDGIHFGSGAPSGELAFLFPGQGSQYVGMLRELSCRFPEMRTALAAAENTAAGVPINDLAFPHPAFDDVTRDAQNAALRATQHAQPAIGALSIGAAALLQRFGISPAATAGHSFGELSALCAAGCLEEKDLHTLARIRGELMAGEPGARGAMLAVAERAEVVEQVLRQEALDLVLANRNAPKQNVLSGAVAEIERATAIFRARQIDAIPLPVSAAFHSTLVADAEAPLAEALASLSWHDAKIPVYANSTAAPYPQETQEAHALLAGQLARPVRFADEVRAMYDDGVRTFVEVGPNTRLTGLVTAILADEVHEAIALDASRGRRSGARDLARVLATVAAQGHSIDLTPWDASFIPPPASSGKAALTYPVGGANIRTRKREPMQSNVNPAGQATPSQVPPQQAAPQPAPQSAAMHAQAHHVQEALRVTQQNMMALQQLQQQTAMLHQQFLQGQQASQQHFQALLQHQQRLMDASMGLPAAVPMPMAMPMAPVAMSPMQMTPPPMPMPVPTPMPVAYAPPAPVAQAPVASAPIAAAPVAPVAAAPVAPAPVAPAPVAAAPAPQAAAGDLEQILLDIVAEKTGYPADILELGMELDADLGIDSIKRVEILSALQDAVPGAPAVKPDQLGTLRTLQAVLDFIQVEVPAAPSAAPSASNGSASHGASSAAGGAPVTPAPTSRPLQRSVLQAREARPGGASQEESTASTASDAPLWISDDDPALAREIVVLLESRGVQTRILSAAQAAAHAGEPVGGLLLLSPRDGSTEETLWHAIQLVQAAAPGLRTAANDGGSFLFSVARMDGAFGMSGQALADPVSGALAGLTKTASHEWPEVRCRALDVAQDLNDRSAAAALVDEMFHTGPLEVGLSAAGRRVLELVAEPVTAADADLPLQKGEVAVISGGARGVTAEAALALAEAWQPTLALLGRSPEPDAEPDWLAALESEGAIKHALLKNGHAASPREAGQAWQRIRSEREVRDNLARLRATGATVLYLSADVCDAEAVRKAIDTIQRDHGPVRVLVHGAGVLADQHIVEKSEPNFRRVYETKVVGLRNLLAPLDRSALRGLVLFSSTTARFGRTGQVDYAMANEVLNKLGQQDAAHHPGCRVVSLGWGPWAGGMVDETLRTVFASEGIPLIPLAEGATQMVRELASNERAVERIIMGPDANAVAADEGTAAPEAASEPTTSAALLASKLPLVWEQALDVARAPVLRSHVIDGHAVVPMALIPEWLAHAAMHGNPGLRFHGFDELRVLRGLVLDATTETTVRVHAGAATREGEHFRIPTELRSRDADGREAFHARADILLAERLPVEKPRVPAPAERGETLAPSEIYPALLFHGEAMQGIDALEACASSGVRARVRTAPPPEAWLEKPARRRWLGDPLALDVAIQLLTVWTTKHHGAPSLPCRAARYRQFRAFPAGGVHVNLQVRESNDRRALADLEFVDDDGRLVARVETLENTIDSALATTFRSNRLVAESRSGRA